MLRSFYQPVKRSIIKRVKKEYRNLLIHQTFEWFLVAFYCSQKAAIKFRGFAINCKKLFVIRQQKSSRFKNMAEYIK